MMNVEGYLLQFLSLTCVIHLASAGCRPCFGSFYKSACQNDFAMTAKITSKSSVGIGQNAVNYYAYGFNNIYLYKQGSGFSTAEPVIRVKALQGTNDCDTPDTEFVVGHYYVLIGKVVTDGSRSLLEVTRCTNMDMETVVNDERALSDLAELKKKRTCPGGKKNWKLVQMVNAFVNNKKG